MKKYIFFTCDGSTMDPDGNDTENCQILGWAEGSDEQEAFLTFKNEYKFVNSYEKVQCQELASEKIYRLI